MKLGQTFRENQKWVTPLGRLGTPDEVGKLVTFLALMIVHLLQEKQFVLMVASWHTHGQVKC